ncbi:GroES-like protein [Mollisia scopiformis]|uniref:GroES-like protein n=1 Tax=Mollisia scopiformis TaxID=149040 RepID=A0A194X4H8_MOLSC|nr:GroES-like protein [Mollisia scopiformis]KUJ15071.1 GroES-like protein [Mollisia scopiformis]
MAPPTSNNAAILRVRHGQHQIVTRATPSILSDEVLIQITATAINPVDWKLRDDFGDMLTYPAVLGSDAAGNIAAVGDEVTTLSVGDRVFFQGIIGNSDASTFQQYCKMPAVLVGKTPSRISDEQAGATSLSSMAAATALYSDTGFAIQPPWTEGGEQSGQGKAIIILGGSSSVGQYAIQLARISGFQRIITNSSKSHFAALQRLGATEVLDRSSATPADYAAATHGLEATHVLDAISIETTTLLAIDILQQLKGGDVVTLLPKMQQPIKPPHPDPQRPVHTKRVVGLGSLPENRHISEPLMNALGGDDGWLAKGIFVPINVEIVTGGLAALEMALAKNKKGVSGVKIVIRPHEG